MTHPLGCRCLTCMTVRLRLVLHSEVPDKINQHATPVMRSGAAGRLTKGRTDDD